MVTESIRKISVGSDVNNQLHISTGSLMAGNTIDTIVDREGILSIYVKDDNNNIKVWKRIVGMPVVIEYNTRLQ